MPRFGELLDASECSWRGGALHFGCWVCGARGCADGGSDGCGLPTSTFVQGVGRVCAGACAEKALFCAEDPTLAVEDILVEAGA
jgi:hypothetical protein